jgi:hypothetical protein
MMADRTIVIVGANSGIGHQHSLGGHVNLTRASAGLSQADLIEALR